MNSIFARLHVYAIFHLRVTSMPTANHKSRIIWSNNQSSHALHVDACSRVYVDNVTTTRMYRHTHQSGTALYQSADNRTSIIASWSE